VSFLFNRATPASASRGLPRTVEIVLATFARGNDGCFIVDGPAIGTDPSRKGSALDVYCVFGPDRIENALNTARGAFANVPGVQLTLLRKSEVADSLMNFVSKRGKVFGDRRSGRR
jgi:hypothetical protein